MKTLFTLIALSVVLTVKTFAQCNPSIPASAVVIKTNTTNTSNSVTIFWVCKGATLTDNGNANDKIYLESGATLKGNGNGNLTIYAPAGATVNYTGNGSGSVYYVNVSDLIATTYLTLHQCTGITYNYTNAPANGCPLCVSSGVMPSGISSSTGSGFCAGKSSTLTQMGGTLNPGAHWAWCSDSCGGAVIDTGASIAVAPTTVTTYYVKVIGDSCNATNCVSITLAPASILTPIIYGPVGSGNFSLCSGQSTTLSVVNSPCVGGGCVYNWSPSGDTGVSISLIPPSLPVTYTVAVSNACGDTVRNSITISDCATGVFTYGNTDGIRIFPNPSHGDFTISMPQTIMEKATIKIYNILGNEVPFSSSEKAGSKTSRDISLERKGSGIYFLQIISNDESYTMKLIIE